MTGAKLLASRPEIYVLFILDTLRQRYYDVSIRVYKKTLLGLRYMYSLLILCKLSISTSNIHLPESHFRPRVPEVCFCTLYITTNVCRDVGKENWITSKLVVERRLRCWDVQDAQECNKLDGKVSCYNTILFF